LLRSLRSLRADRALEPADFVVARRRYSVSPPSSLVRLRAILYLRPCIRAFKRDLVASSHDRQRDGVWSG